MKKSQLKEVIRQQLNEADIVDVLRKIAAQRRKEGKPMAGKGGSIKRVRVKGSDVATKDLPDLWNRLIEASADLNDLATKIPRTHTTWKENFGKMAQDSLARLKKMSIAISKKRDDTTYNLLEHNSDEKHLIAEADIVDVLQKIAAERQSGKGRKDIDPLRDEIAPILKNWEKQTADWQKNWQKVHPMLKLKRPANALAKHADVMSAAAEAYFEEVYQRAVDQEKVRMGDIDQKKGPKGFRQKMAVLSKQAKERSNLSLEPKRYEKHEENTMKITKSRFKEIIREELAELRNISEETTLTGKEVASRIKNSKDKGHKMFFGKKTIDAIAKKGKWTAKELDNELPDFIPGNLIHGLFNENVNEYVDLDLLTKRQPRIVSEMRPHVSKSLPGKAVWQHIEDNLDWEMYLGSGGMKELEKELKRMKKVTSQQLDQMVPGFIPGNEVYGVFKNHLAIGPTE